MEHNILNLKELEGLNQEEFDSIISDPESLQWFINREGYENLLTEEQIEQLNIILNE
jgi:hypothetical protein